MNTTRDATSGDNTSQTWSVLLTLMALLTASVATYFFVTVGQIDPLRDTFFSLAIALDLLTLFLTWRAVRHARFSWLGPISPFVRVRILRNRARGLQAVVRVMPKEQVSVVTEGRAWRYGLLILATLLYGVSMGAFARQGNSLLVYGTWAASVLALLAAYMPEQWHWPRIRWGETATVTVLLGLGFALRFYDLTVLPLKVHGDMASVGLQARDILEGDFPGWFSLGWATIPMWGYAHEALTMLLFGDSLFGLRMSAVMAGMASLLGVYMLGREAWTTRVGMLALAALAIDVVHIHFSRIPSYIDPVPWMVWALFLTVRGLRRRSPTAWALAGFCTAVAVNMYFSGRLIIFILVFFLLYLAVFHLSLLRQNREGLLAFALAFTFTFGPMLIVVARHLPEYVSRARYVSLADPGVYQHLLGKYQVSTLREVILEQVQRTFLTFQYYGDTSTQFGYAHPMLSPWLVPFFLIGVGVATGRLRHVGNILLSLWLALGLVLGSVLTVDAPFWPRLVVITPANALAIALGMQWVIAVLGAKRWWRHNLVLLILMGIMGWAGWQNWTTYTSVAKHVSGKNDFVARVIQTLGERPACFIRGEHTLSEREFQFLLHGRADREIDPKRWEEDARACVKAGGVVIALESERYIVDYIAARYPGGELKEIHGPSGHPQLILYDLQR